jgi:hypothetical protein
MFENVDFITTKLDDNSISINARDVDKSLGLSEIHIDYYVKKKIKTSKGERLIWNDDYKPKVYKMPFSKEEEWAAERFNRWITKDISKSIIVNPDAKHTFFNKNKMWGFDKWQELTTRLSKDYQIVRIMPGSEYKHPFLQDAYNIKSPNLRRSLCFMSKAMMGVTFNGLLEHLWGGYDVPCIRICGDFISSKHMGYPTTHSVALDESPCGATYECEHCKKANKKITVDMVYEACIETLNNINRRLKD